VARALEFPNKDPSVSSTAKEPARRLGVAPLLLRRRQLDAASLVRRGDVRAAAASTHDAGPRRQRAAPPGPRRREEAATLDVDSYRRRRRSTSRHPGSVGGVTMAGSNLGLVGGSHVFFIEN
jgi:hypothetical protein